ncbi:MAG: sulfatase [Alphaproteobacteria bacterium]
MDERDAATVAKSEDESPRARAAGRSATRLRMVPAILAAAVAVALWLGVRHGALRGEADPSGAAVPRAGAPRPNLLVVSLDTTRADHLSAYGYDRPTTPRLEALLPSSVRFDAAYTPMPSTMPAHSSLFTSLFPRTHGVRKNGVPLAKTMPTLAESLSAAGWRTAGFASSFVLHRKFGISRGFATWDDDFAGVACKGWTAGDGDDESFCRRGAQTRERALAWLDANGWLDPSRRPAEPFFLFVHLFDAHNPYAPPAEDARLFPPRGDAPSDLDREIAAYDGEIHYADAQLGALLDRLAAAGVLDDTLVMVVGDHGEGLMQHGWMNHGMMIYEEAVRVPLVVRWPSRLSGGRRVEAPVELVDLAPTMFDLLGVTGALPARQGRSLAPDLLGERTLDPEAPAFVQRRVYKRQRRRDDFDVKGEKTGVRVGRWKYLEAPEEGTRELYDLDRDPGELSNLAGERPDDVARLAGVLAAWRARTPEGGAGEVAPDDVERLRALGYVQ